MLTNDHSFSDFKFTVALNEWRSLELQPFQHPHGHMIAVWSLGNPFLFMTGCQAPCDHVNAICNFSCRSESQRGRWQGRPQVVRVSFPFTCTPSPSPVHSHRTGDLYNPCIISTTLMVPFTPSLNHAELVINLVNNCNQDCRDECY